MNLPLRISEREVSRLPSNVTHLEASRQSRIVAKRHPPVSPRLCVAECALSAITRCIVGNEIGLVLTGHLPAALAGVDLVHDADVC
jgi:hypothetical protein